jgi:S1-C subfamily serine protease
MSLAREVVGSAQLSTAGGGTKLTGKGVTIAVIDSGIDASHPDFRGNGNSSRVLASVDFTSSTRAGDPNGHGTGVASVAAGNGAASNGLNAGIAPEANIVSLRALDETGAGTTADVMRAVNWAVANSDRFQIRVLNMSLGTPVRESFRSDPLCRAVARAVSAGIVVAAGQAATPEGPRTGDWLQADVTLLPGNSGGPLVDARGRVVGIATMVSGELSLAIPSQAVEIFVAGGRPGQVRGYLGVNGIVVPLRRADHPLGFLLTEVVEGTPADRAGLTVGDVVVALGERAIADQESLPAALLRLKPGEAVTVAVLRGGEPRSFVVVPTERA